jgi:hypothetical protein
MLVMIYLFIYKLIEFVILFEIKLISKGLNKTHIEISVKELSKSDQPSVLYVRFGKA